MRGGGVRRRLAYARYDRAHRLEKIELPLTRLPSAETLRTQFGARRTGLWVTPQGGIRALAQNVHILEVIRAPEEFGTTSEHIVACYRDTGEPVGFEGVARERIILECLQRGWVRGRNYDNYWEITLDGTHTGSVARTARFVRAFLRAGIMTKASELRISDMSRSRQDVCEVDDWLALKAW